MVLLRILKLERTILAYLDGEITLSILIKPVDA